MSIFMYKNVKKYQIIICIFLGISRVLILFSRIHSIQDTSNVLYCMCAPPVPSGGLSGVSGIWISNWIVWIRNLVCSPIPARTYGLHKFLTRPHKLLLKQEDVM